MNNIERFANYLLTYCNFRVVISCIFLIIFAMSFISSSFVAIKQNSFFNSFLQTDGKIIKCNIEQQIDTRNNFTRYGLRIYYTYNVNDISYCGSDIFDSYSSLLKAKENLNFFSNYNDSIIVYYNPTQHNMSLLNKGYLYLITYITFFTAVGLIFIAIIIYYFRNNPFFCGTILASDITSLL